MSFTVFSGISTLIGGSFAGMVGGEVFGSGEALLGASAMELSLADPMARYQLLITGGGSGSGGGSDSDVKPPTFLFGRTPLEAETERLFTEATGYQGYPMPFSFFQGESGRFVRSHLEECKELAGIMISTNDLRALYNFGISHLLEPIERFGMKPVIDIARAHPERAWALLATIGERGDLISRVGLAPFASIAQRFEDPEYILKVIKGDGRSDLIPDEAGLFRFAEQVERFRLKTRHMEKLQWHYDSVLSDLIEHYGIDHLHQLATVIAVGGENSLEWIFHWEGKPISPGRLQVGEIIRDAQPVIDAYGWDAFERVYALFEGEMGSVVKNLEALRSLYPSAEDLLDAMEMVPNLSPKHPRTSWRNHNSMVDALFGIPANRELIRIFGMDALLDIFAEGIFVDERFVKALGAAAHLVTDVDSLRRINLTIERSDDRTQTALPALGHLIQSEEDIATIDHCVSGMNRAFVGTISPVAPLMRTMDDLRQYLSFVNFLAKAADDGVSLIHKYAGTCASVEELPSKIFSEPVGRLLADLGLPAVALALSSCTGSRPRILKALPLARHLEDFEDRLGDIAQFLFLSASEEVLTALPSVVSAARNFDEFQGVIRLLHDMGESSFPLVSALSSDIRSTEDLQRLADFNTSIWEKWVKEIGEDQAHIRLEAMCRELAFLCRSFGDLDACQDLERAGFNPTPLTLDLFRKAEDKKALFRAWKTVLDTFAEGGFDAGNELHRHLEYTRFRAIIDHEKVRRHVKNHFTIDQYLSIFEAVSGQQGAAFSPVDRFEIACASHESRLLEAYILKVKEQADRLGRPVWVVPNLSYGYLPVAPLIANLEKNGIEVPIGMKVGSTESHENQEVLNSRLFKGHRKRMLEERPIIVVVDGTQHLIDRDQDHLAGRYPDAYQGYLNTVIALNEALGAKRGQKFVGKTDDDLVRLRASEEFQRLVDVYGEMSAKEPGEGREAYSFQLWNTAGMDLILRGNRQQVSKMPPFDPSELQGPAVIFCNVGVLHDQLPAELKAQAPEGYQHTPAYYDDSGKILAIDVGFDRYGVRYLNRLETEVKKAYGQTDADDLSTYVARIRASRRAFRTASPQPESRRRSRSGSEFH